MSDFYYLETIPANLKNVSRFTKDEADLRISIA